MTVHLIAALPGTGKTNYVVGSLIPELLKTDKNRPIFLLNFNLLPAFFELYHEVQLLTVPTHNEHAQLDAVAYQNKFFPVVKDDTHQYPHVRAWLPDGAILIIDEAQHFFPSERNYRLPPCDFLRYLQTHRHFGHDFYFISQSGQLLDTHIRKQCGAYLRLIRPFGQRYFRLERYSQYLPDDRLKSTSRESKKRVPFVKQAFKLYQSTVQDTIKPRVPFKLVLLLFSIVFVAVLMWFTLSVLSGSGGKDVKKEPEKIKPASELPQKIPILSPYVLVGGARFGNRYVYLFAESVTCLQRKETYLLERGVKIQPIDSRSVRLDGRLHSLTYCVSPVQPSGFKKTNDKDEPKI
ncbi:zonula occludens toxin [Beggiatoa alba B18LD]|uniref:Zonula occludens toxin n=1 Tax=Beggiatoa alba B18LD TaxID=395493 RepID=I3CE08_9GAMM|nr:zonular occludens toxin domain-containing protein [Beggiatoa alba]EIJ41851.1 zonula occludens toxin [Beggiatoa alba B18LD]